LKRLIICSILLFFCSINTPIVFSGSDDPVVKRGCQVSFHYILKIDGAIVETTKQRAPLTYNHGEGQIIKGLSSALLGLKTGEKKTVILHPKDAYGDIHQKAFVDILRASIPETNKLVKGAVMQINAQDGTQTAGIISDVKEDVVVVNLNHPLAGKTLEFEVEIVGIKPAER